MAVTKFNLGSLSGAGKVLGLLNISKNPNGFLTELSKKINSNDKDSPRQIVGRLGDLIAEEVRQVYDTTRSPKNAARRSGKLRDTLKKVGPFQAINGNLKVLIAPNMPPYWIHQEFGTKQSPRVQGYQVLGLRSTGQVPGAGPNSTSREFILPAGFNRGAAFGRPVKLVARTKADLARIKNKVFLEFTHPGFQGGKFIRAGIIWTDQNAAPYLEKEFGRMIQNTFRRTNK